MYAWCAVPTELGSLALASTSDGLVSVSFGDGNVLVRQLSRRGPVRPARMVDPTPADLALRLAAEQLREYAAGQRTSFSMPLDWSLTSGVQRHVLNTLYESVQYGQTITYGELARRCGLDSPAPPRSPAQTGGARVVGQIMGSNPLPIVVACHRVLAADGLGGYGPGVELKRRILVLEGSMAPSLFEH